MTKQKQKQELLVTVIDNIFLNSIEFNTYSGFLTLQILDHLPQFLQVFQRWWAWKWLERYPWDNILSQDNISASLAFDLFFARINTLLDEHALNHKLYKWEISLNVKPWINENFQPLMRERDRLFKCYCSKYNP